MATIKIENLVKEINDKEFISILGESGAGKSMLLNCIAGFIEVSAGIIKVDDIDVTNEIQSHCTNFKIPIVAKVPFDKEIVYAMVNKQTIVEYNKNSKIVGILKDAYEYILNN